MQSLLSGSHLFYLVLRRYLSASHEIHGQSEQKNLIQIYTFCSQCLSLVRPGFPYLLHIDQWVLGLLYLLQSHIRSSASPYFLHLLFFRFLTVFVFMLLLLSLSSLLLFCYFVIHNLVMHKNVLIRKVRFILRLR